MRCGDRLRRPTRRPELRCRRALRLRFVVSADAEGVEPNGRFVRSMALIAKAVLSHWMGPIAAVCVCGRKAADVLAEEAAEEDAQEAEEADDWSGAEPAGTVH